MGCMSSKAASPADTKPAVTPHPVTPAVAPTASPEPATTFQTAEAPDVSEPHPASRAEGADEPAAPATVQAEIVSPPSTPPESGTPQRTSSGSAMESSGVKQFGRQISGPPAPKAPPPPAVPKRMVKPS